MGTFNTLRQKTLWIGPVLAALMAGCAGIEPYEPYDYRQDGPKQGLISGPTGEFVIFRKPDDTEKTDGEEEKKSSQNAEQ